MTTRNCLNCGNELSGKYCSGCGQKADIHRITFKNFIVHDLLHGAFHIEKGMLFTGKNALIRPGQAALEYISGKRKRYYNVFLLILLVFGLMLFTRHADEVFAAGSEESVQDEIHLNEASRRMDEIFSQKSKILLCLFIPFAALNSFLLFKRKRLNLSEHAIISAMVLLGILLLSTLGNILLQVNMSMRLDVMPLSLIITAMIVFYVGHGYFNAFSDAYSKPGIAYRIVLFFALFCLETALLIYLLIGYVTDWQYDTTVKIAPFG
jgi:hypothetical protein